MSRQLKFMVACQKRLNRCHFLSRHFLIYFDHWKRAGQLSMTSIVQNHAFHNRTTFTNHFVITSLNMLLSPSKISVQKSKNDIKISIFWWFFPFGISWNENRGADIRLEKRWFGSLPISIPKNLEMSRNGPFCLFQFKDTPSGSNNFPLFIFVKGNMPKIPVYKQPTIRHLPIPVVEWLCRLVFTTDNRLYR